MIEHYVDWGLAREKITHVTNGQRDYSGGVRPIPASPTHHRFGFFGQFVDVKGVQVILQAVQLLRSQGFTEFSIDLNGDNLRYASATVRAEIETFLADEAKLPLAQRLVTNNGPYHVDQLAARMRRIDWCLVPSTWWEIFGLVVSEAWMFGRPVICSDLGGPAERVRHDIDGLHFPMGDAGGLADVIRRAATETGLWERLSAALPAPPSRAAMIDSFREIYQRHGTRSA